MNSIKERFQSLRENYTIANAINYVDFLDECRKSDVVDCFESTFVEPIKGAEFTKKFILINSFSENELNMMKATLESFLEKAENSFYENEAHMSDVRECLEIIDAKLECVEHISLVDLVLESFYLDDMEITCEGAQKSDATIKQIISKDIDDETKVKLANKLIEQLKADSFPLNTVKGVNTLISTTAIVIYYALTVPIAVVGLLLPVPIIMVSNLINSGAKAGNIAIYKRVLDSEIKKVEAAQKTGKASPDVETYRQNLLQARQMLDETKKVTLESTLMDLDESESVHEKINVLDSAIRENFVRFALSEEETVEESVQWFNNIIALSNTRDLVVEELTQPVTESFGSRYTVSIKLQKSLGDAKRFKSIAKQGIDNAESERELTYTVNLIKSYALSAKHPVLIGGSVGSVADAIVNREDSKEIGAWIKSDEFIKMVEARKKKLQSVKESFEDDEFDDLEDELDDIFDDFEEEEEFVEEGTKADDRRKKVNVTANKIKSKAHKLKDKAKRAGQSSKAAIHQVGKAGKALDDAATNTVNKVKSTYRNDIREEIIEDKTRIKLFRIIRKGIGVGAATMVNPAVGAITALATYALNKKVKEKERRRILHELNEELEIVNEKIDDARGDSNKEKKYQLMRIRNQLNRDIKRIQYRVKSDGKGV